MICAVLFIDFSRQSEAIFSNLFFLYPKAWYIMRSFDVHVLSAGKIGEVTAIDFIFPITKLNNMTTITISQSKIQQQKGVVILPLKEYKKLLEQAVPTYYLKGKEAKKLDRLVSEGLREYREGKTREIKFLADLD